MNVDEPLAEIFLEERQPTEDEIHVILIRINTSDFIHVLFILMSSVIAVYTENVILWLFRYILFYLLVDLYDTSFLLFE